MNHSMQINPDISFEVYDFCYMLMQLLNQVSKQEGSREQSTKRGDSWGEGSLAGVCVGH